ncbi:MAG: DUF302 domain-containing protein [Hyphomicrobiaceae bacterium]|nr:DUF302 domain-containing protein [Hyphomicrobiaceae bacterium]
MSARFAFVAAATLAVLLALPRFAGAPGAVATTATDVEDGIVHVRSAYTYAETIERLQRDIAAKGIRMFAVVDQSGLAAAAGVPLAPSTLLIFGNPPLGAQFITSRASAGLDWPVRLLVQQDERGAVWARYTDFAWIARRHRIEDRKEAFEKAAGVIASITSSVAAR